MAKLRVLLLALLIAAGCGDGTPPGEPPPELALVDVLETPEPGVLDHVGRRFTLRYPPSWKAVRAVVDGGQVAYFLTPGKETRPRRMRVSLKLGFSSIPRASQLQGKDAISLVNHWLPSIRARSPEIVPDGDVRKATMGTLAAAALTFHGPMKYQQGRFRFEFHMAPQGDLQFYTFAVAPEDEFDEYADAFEKILSESRFGRASPPRLARSLEARHVVERHKAATVSIIAGEGGQDMATGTGFLISQAGHLLTNWHVIMNQRKGKPWSEFRVEWDPTLRLSAKPAKLIAYRVQAGIFKTHYEHRTWGTDIALLKVAPGDYPAFPLTPLRDVQPGDGVVTLGFPSRGILKDLAITITRGVVTRFNRDPKGNVRSIFTDAAITHGSSGGPCVSLVTGGVVGLNTFGQPIERGAPAGGRDLNDLVNYFGVVPIDACFREFPLVCDLGLAHDIGDLGFMDCFELARLFQDSGSKRTAAALADRAARLKPDSADALWLQASSKLQMAFVRGEEAGKNVDMALYDAAFAAFKAVLKIDPAHGTTLNRLAHLCMDRRKFDDAARYADQAIREAPGQWHTLDTRAQVAIKQKQYAEAVDFAEKAKEMCGNEFAGPSITAGTAHYANKAYDAGRAEYENAVKIHPQNLKARIGVGRCYEYKKQTEKALAEYKKILFDFTNNALVLQRMGETCAAAKRHRDAANYLYRAVRAYEGGGERPPNAGFEALVGALDALKDNRKGLILCGQWLSHIGATRKSSVLAHLHAHDFANRLKLTGLAHAHARVARSLTQNAKTKAAIDKIRLRSLAVDDIVSMVRLGYRTDVAVPLIRRSPLGFIILAKSQVDTLRKRGIPDEWILAVLAAQKRASPPKRPPAAASGSRALVGTWRAATRQRGRRVTLVFQFTSTGRFVADGYRDGRRFASDRGTYKANGRVLTMTDWKGKVHRRAYTLRGNQLSLTTDGYGRLAFQRQR